MIIDAHLHLNPNVDGTAVGAVNEISRQLKLAGINSAIVLQLQFQPWSIEEVSKALSIHDNIKAFVNVHPDEEGALSKLEYAIRELNYIGLKLHPRLQEFDLGSSACANLVKKAGELKIPVLMEKAPETLAQAYKEIEVLGAVTDHTSEAKKVTFKMSALIKSILNRAKVSGKVTFFHELDNTLYSVTSDTFIGKVYKDFGLINIADKAAGADSYGYPQLSAEYLVKSDPTIIFLADAEYGESAATVKARAGWSGITAVAKKNVFALPNDIPSRWGPRLIDFYRFVAACLTKVKK